MAKNEKGVVAGAVVKVDGVDCKVLTVDKFNVCYRDPRGGRRHESVKKFLERKGVVVGS